MAMCKYFPVVDMTGTGRSIERCRKAAGLSVRDVQAYFGFEYPQAIYKWQHGECLPSADNLLALARLLQVNMEDLLVYRDREVSLFLERTFHAPSGACAHFLCA
ncbi:MAG: helix-turn-helix transcriptional regulator [Clostridia bacterium]|nr:helix-turn-helix transcriptional regulator [Clostridia bacterium]